MLATAPTATRSTVSHAPEPRAGRPRPRPAASSAPPRRASDLPREYRIAHVYRSLGRGLVAEYDPE